MPHSNAFRDLVTKLLEKDPRDRIGHEHGVEQILEHEWFADCNQQDFLEKRIEAEVPDDFFDDTQSLKYFNKRFGNNVLKEESTLGQV